MENQSIQWEGWDEQPPQIGTKQEQSKMDQTKETSQFFKIPTDYLIKFHHPLFTNEVMDLSEEGKKLPEDVFNSNPNLISQCRNFVKVYLKNKKYTPKQKLDFSFFPYMSSNQYFKSSHSQLTGVMILDTNDEDVNITISSLPTENNLFKIGSLEEKYDLYKGDVLLFESSLDFELSPNSTAIVFEVIPKNII